MRLLIALALLAGCATPAEMEAGRGRRAAELDAALTRACIASGFRDEFVARCKRSRLEVIQRCMLTGYSAETCIPPGLAVTGPR